MVAQTSKNIFPLSHSLLPQNFPLAPQKRRADENRWWKRCVRNVPPALFDCCCSVYRTTSCCCARHRILRSSKLSVVAA
ncbi:hypothetical protein CEXT_490961 [Caerostris extrusa]|uniref:Uncharacterized protein n=1 Tax=Caerostris extrusa TaxID=172846 RepID=A0AAV4XPJ7_CAEEX|nr:hypothetical protein CEXT_490961 [Caerostris extrusa]